MTAAATMFAIVDAVLLRSLPYHKADRLALLTTVSVIACYLPAARVARLDAAHALRRS